MTISRLRGATPDEAETLTALQRRASDWEGDREFLAAHPEVIGVSVDAIRDGRVRVAEDDGGTVLGFSVVVDHDGAVELDDLFVEPELQHRGVGRALVADVVEHARGGGATRVDVIANPDALGFYEKVGFIAGETVPTLGRDALRMHLPL